MRSERNGGRPVVAVVGAGFSGTLVAVHLAARGAQPILIERFPPLGRGVAYSTQSPVHLLNVRAGNMSAFPDEPGNFAGWAGVGPESFVPRRDYGSYLAHLLQSAGSQVRQMQGTAVALSPDGSRYRLQLASGEAIEADAVVLAMGNVAPRLPREIAGLADSNRLVGDPWSPDGQVAIDQLARSSEDVLILGTGLTMVDVALSLDAGGHRGRIIALSRRGLAPRAHASHEPVGAGDLPEQLMPLLRQVRRAGREENWRGVVDSLRPHTQRLWQGFTVAEKRRFLRHLRPWWDVHRHRIAPAVAERFRALQDDGRLELLAGRLRAVEEVECGLEITFTPRGGMEDRRVQVAALINCSGQGDLAGTSDTFVASVLTVGIGKLDPLGLGFAVDEEGRLSGTAYALGPLTKGCFWEIVAVPDIRGQAERVADALCRRFHGVEARP